MPNKISLLGIIEGRYLVCAPRQLLFDGDGPSFYESYATSLEDAREKASKLTNAKIFLTEWVTVEGFSGMLTRNKEIK